MTGRELLELQECDRGGCVCHQAVRKGQGLTHCVAHHDENPSLNVSERDGTTLFRCHAGCPQERVLAAVAELAPRGVSIPPSNGTRARREVATYDYQDEAGELLYQVVRYEPKDFRQRKPKAGGGWSWSLNGTRRVLYHLPELLAAKERSWILLVEGEKDADRLRSLGLHATCYAGGVKAPWQPAWSEALRGRRVAILPDADRPGLARAERDAIQLSRVCSDLRVVALPGLTVRPDHGEDVSDWLEHHGVDELKRLVSATPAWQPGQASADVEEPSDEAEESEPVDEEEALPSTWAPMDIAAILAGDLSPLETTLLRREDGIPLLYPGRVSMFVGEPESCKSWAAQLAAAQAIAAGDNVLYVDFEAEARDVVGHLLALGIEGADLADRLLYVRPEESFDDNGRTALLAAVARRRPGYIVLDGVSTAMVAEGLEPNSNKEFIQWWNRLVRPLRGCTEGPLVLVDHVSKDKEHRGDWAVGAGQKKARVDGAMLAFDLVQPFGRGKTGIISILLFKDRPGYLRGRTVNGKEIARLELVSDPENETVEAKLLLPAAGSVPDKSGEWQPTGLMERVSQLLERSDEPLSRAKVEAAVHGKREYVRRALDALVETGFVERFEQSLGGRSISLLHRSLMPYLSSASSSPANGARVGARVPDDHPSDPLPESGGEGQEASFEFDPRNSAPPSPHPLPGDRGEGSPGLTKGVVPDVRSTSTPTPKGGGRAGGGDPVAPTGRVTVGTHVCPYCDSDDFRPVIGGRRLCTNCGHHYLGPPAP